MTATTLPPPGFHLDVSELDYDALPAIRSTALNAFNGKTPAHVYHSIHSGGKDTTTAMGVGTLLHLAVLEPDRFEAEVIVRPTGDKRYKEVKQKLIEFEAAYPKDTFRHVDADTLAKVKAMAEGIRIHPTAGELTTGRGRNEVTVIWRDETTELDCKARIDRVTNLNEWPVIVDVKSTRSAGLEDWNKSVNNFGYDVQAAHYLAGVEAVAPTPPGAPFRRFLYVLVENVPPYLAAVRELDDAALEEGAIKRARYLRKLKTCLESGIWPGFPDGIEYCSLPAWAFRNYVDED